MDKKRLRNKPKDVPIKSTQIFNKKKKPRDQLVGIFGLGATIVFFLLPKTPRVIIISLALIFVLFGYVCWNLEWIKKFLWRKIVSLLLLCLLLVMLGAYVWPTKDQIKVKTLRELFLSDFNKTHMLANYPLTKNNKVVYEVQYIIWGDFDTKSLFFSIYMPKSDYTNYTFAACKFLIPKYKEILEGHIKSLMKRIIYHSPGSKAERWDELSFSGRVYIYHETRLLPARIDLLTEEYKKAGLSPQFRGRDYLLMRNSPLWDTLGK